jgi:RNA polymerase sigma-70 factor, ECF subfamily
VTPQDPDAPLVDLAQQGDQKALEELYRRHERRAYNLALRTVGDPWEAADVTQDAFVKALSALPGFRTESRFSTWLHRIVVNTAYDHLRRRRAGPLQDEALERAAAADPTRPPSPDPSAADTLPRPLREAVLALPDAFRLAVVLCDLLDFSYAEAAEILEVAEGTIKSRLFRARALLAKDLTQRGYAPGQQGGNNPASPPVSTSEHSKLSMQRPRETP